MATSALGASGHGSTYAFWVLRHVIDTSSSDWNNFDGYIAKVQLDDPPLAGECFETLELATL